MTGIRERRWVRQAQAGDERAFERLAAKVQPSLRRVALGYLAGNEAEAADAVQETLVSAWKNIGGVREPRYFRTWITRICINACRDLQRRRTPEPLGDAAADRPDPRASADKALLARAGFETLTAAAGASNAPAIALFYGEGYSTEEIAALLDVSPDVVRQRLSRGRKAITKTFSRTGLVVALVVAALLAVGTACAAVIAGLTMDQTDAHQVAVTPTLPEGEGVAPLAEGESIPEYALNFSYLPSTLTDKTIGSQSATFYEPGYERWSQLAPSIFCDVYYVDTDEAAPFASVENGQLLDIRGHQAVLLEFDYGYRFSKRRVECRLFIAFPEERRIVRLQTFDESLKDELMRMAESMSLEATGGKVPPEEQLLWSQQIQEAQWDAADMAQRYRNEFEYPSGALAEPVSAEAMGNMLAVDDVFHPGGNENVEARVAALSFSDDASALEGFDFLLGWQWLIGKDGRFESDTISFIRYGDGVATADELVEQRESPLLLVQVDMAYTNTGSEPQASVPVTLALESAVLDGDTWRQYRRLDEVPEADEVQNSLSVNDHYGLTRRVVEGDAHLQSDAGYFLDELQPGETAVVRYFWLVNADEADKLLLDVNPDGYPEPEEGAYGQRLMDIRQ
ncbi:sigma-70 family RNA polymerase sigma factor [uncultured Adlercreutzia sp.]|uniref:RNA polymerase sigma factor n=1 Tax=uncultured Adlercreutzia sp. TaxID=875803 RepID=UPI0025D4088E|nr:sigma-70 family RNA polymerase sigma factor [uncultured Adlercreutzia sp.]